MIRWTIGEFDIGAFSISYIWPVGCINSVFILDESGVHGTNSVCLLFKYVCVTFIIIFDWNDVLVNCKLFMFYCEIRFINFVFSNWLKYKILFWIL